MTLKGKKQLPKELLRRLARLVHLHHQTHPDCIGHRYGISGNYVRQLWRESGFGDMAPIEEVLDEVVGKPKDHR